MEATGTQHADCEPCVEAFSESLQPFAATEAGEAWLLQCGTADESQYILETLNGNIPQGLHDPVAIRPSGSGNAGDTRSAHATGAAGKGKGKDQVTLYVTGLPLESTDDSLFSFFDQFGEVYDSKILPVSEFGSTMEGTLRMSQNDGAWCVENLNNFQPAKYPAPLSVTFPKDHGDKGGPSGKALLDTDATDSMHVGSSHPGHLPESTPGPQGRSWTAEPGWGNGNDVTKGLSGGKGPYGMWDPRAKGPVKGAQGKELGFADWGGGWGKGGKFAKGKGKRPGPY